MYLLLKGNKADMTKRPTFYTLQKVQHAFDDDTLKSKWKKNYSVLLNLYIANVYDKNDPRPDVTVLCLHVCGCVMGRG